MEKQENLTTRATKDQIERLVQIMEQNSEVAKEICSNPAVFWNEVGIELNSLGPSKDKYTWKKTWTDKKSNVKKKFNQIIREQKKTGGGIPLAIRLSDIEERILNVTSIRANAEGVNDSICIGVPVHTLEHQEEQVTSIIEYIEQEGEDSLEPTTSHHKTARSIPEQSNVRRELQQKGKQPDTQNQTLDANQETLIKQNEIIAKALTEFLSCFKQYAEGTATFRKEMLEYMKKKAND